MLGNDIVDLNHLPDKSRSLSFPYLNKICTIIEIDKILDSDDAVLMLWRIWTMKESAYKIALKLGAKRAFNPKKFETLIVDSSNGLVITEYGTIFSKTEVNSNFIHTISSFSKTKSFHAGSATCCLDHSESVRSFLINDFKEHNNYNFSTEIVMLNNIPQLITKIGNIDISLSHHGGYIAWVFENL